MKHLKLFEIYIDSRNVEEFNKDYADILKRFSFKIGDYVRLPNLQRKENIFKYNLEESEEWVNSKNLVLVPDYELAAMKYNM